MGVVNQQGIVSQKCLLNHGQHFWLGIKADSMAYNISSLVSKSAIVSVVVVGLACTGLFASFVNSASPYTTISEARKSRGGTVHLVGDIVPNTIQSMPRERTVQFQISDSTGEKVTVHYKGNAPAALSTANRVDAVGQMDCNVFRSEKLLLKCPSKYESQTAEKATR